MSRPEALPLDPPAARIGRRERALWRAPLFWLTLAFFVAETVTGLGMTFTPLGVPRLPWFEAHLWTSRVFLPLFAIFLYRHLRGVGPRRVYVVMFGYWFTLFVLRFLGGNSLFLILPLSIGMLWWMFRKLTPWMRGLDPAAAGLSFLVFVLVQVTMATGIGTHFDVMLVDHPFMRHQGIFAINFLALHQWAGIGLPLFVVLHLGLRRILETVPAGLEWLRRVRARQLAPLLLASMFGTVAWNWNLRHHGKRHADDFVPVEWSNVEKAQFCSNCHWDEYRQWSVSLHRFGASNELYQASVRVAIERHGEDSVAYCHRCHDPTYELRAAAGALAEESEGITCISCHRALTVPDEPRNGDLTIGMMPIPGGASGSDPGYEKRLTRSIEADSRAHRRDMNPLGPRVQVCQSCHRVDLGAAGAHGVLIEDVSTSWFEGPYGKVEDNSCILCHMPRIKALPWELEEARGHKHPHHGVFGMNQSVALIEKRAGIQATLEQRDEVAVGLIREFPGLSLVQQVSQMSHGSIDPLYKLNQRAETLPLTIAMTAKPPRAGRLELGLVTTNVRAGHALPAGADDLSETWLSLTLVDAAGQRFPLMGVLAEDGSRDEAALELGARWLDRDGQPIRHHDLYSLAKVADERRIKLGEALSDTVEVALPAGVSGEVKVEAAWNYRRVRPSASEDLLGERRPFPVTAIGVGEVAVTLPPA